MNFTYLNSISRRLVLDSFSDVTSGALRVENPHGEAIMLGSMAPSAPSPTIMVHSDLFWTKILLLGDIGFAESYMLHEISSSDLTAVFEFFIRNSAATNKAASSGLWSCLFGGFSQLFCRGRVATNDISTAQLNATAHYSLSNDIFRAFLSPDMTYSAPIWLPESDPLATDQTLEDAQLRKLRYALRQMRVRRSDHVLEIGTGWGSLAIVAARTTGCRVTTVTLSREQKLLAEERIAEAGLGGQVQVLEADYRELEGLGPFDKIVSIEMIEHVGHDFLGTFFERMDRLLKPDGGIGYFQCITIPETRYGDYCRGEDFIKKYIFPGGHLPTVSGLVANIASGSRGKLIVEEIRSLGVHYPRALRSWRERFQSNFEAEIVPALQKVRPSMTAGEMDLFQRKWEYYFCYCEAGFKTKSLGNVAITVGRENCIALLEEA